MAPNPQPGYLRPPEPEDTGQVDRRPILGERCLGQPLEFRGRQEPDGRPFLGRELDAAALRAGDQVSGDGGPEDGP
jgi:hypothetical protein